jgi:hypothetical protein
MADEERGVRELCNTPERMALFRAQYRVPDDVVLTLKAEDDLTEGPDDNILLPVTAISQAGIRFPLNSFMREVLHQLGASTNNTTVNTLRILTAIGILKETETLNFNIYDLFGVYTVSWNNTYERWYLQRLPKFKADLIRDLPDTNKRSYVYFYVTGNFEFPADAVDRRMPIPRRGRRPGKPSAVDCYSFTLAICLVI